MGMQRRIAMGTAGLVLFAGAAMAQRDQFPPFETAAKDYEKVVSTTDGEGGLFNLYIRRKDGQMLAELPRGYERQRHFIAMTVPHGELFAGLQAGDMVVYWKRYDDRIALMTPNLSVRSSGDPESKSSIKNHYTDTVLIDMPIVCMGPSGQPVIDLDNLLLGNASVFYGGQARGLRSNLATIERAKSFPENMVVAWEVPDSSGNLKTFYYSISRVTGSAGYKPRESDERIGYFTTEYRDLGKFRDDQVTVRYINRWHLEKRDPKLSKSYPKQPIVFYLEHTVPPRYRRWVKAGVEYWNKAFEQVGYLDAIEVRFQDEQTGQHMEKDPEDVRYNFIRWLSNDIGTAIGPSRAHPETGEILDADIVLTDGWIRHFWFQANELLPETALEGMSAEALVWLDRNPSWDPRLLLARPEERERMLVERERRGPTALRSGNAAEAVAMDDPAIRSLAERFGHDHRLCMAAGAKARDMAIAGLYFELLDPPKEGEKREGDLIDGIPEWFIGPMLAELTCHEVGHTLGLRHNFRASGVYSLAEINSESMKGLRPLAGSVMDYLPVNINMEDGPVQGDYSMIGVGPYDMWAIEYGYTSGDTKEVLKRVSQPELMYATDEDTGGPDPLARRYDFARDPIEYAKSRLRLAQSQRAHILDKFVKEGEGWWRARRGYLITLNTQMDAVSIMAGWLGGTFVVRDRKGDPGERVPITPVPVEQQRAALRFVIDNALHDGAFGLTPEILSHMLIDRNASRADPTFDVHDRILGVQGSVLTMLMNPTTLRRVYDNEFLVGSGEDAITLPELFGAVRDAVWAPLARVEASKKYTARAPALSSIQRNLQRVHIERLIDLSMDNRYNAASRPVANLATMELRRIHDRVASSLVGADGLDDYTLAHLSDAKLRIEKALDAQYIYSSSQQRGPVGGMFFGQPEPVDAAATVDLARVVRELADQVAALRRAVAESRTSEQP